MRSILLHSGLAALAAFSLIGIGRIEPWSLLYRPRRVRTVAREEEGGSIGWLSGLPALPFSSLDWP